MSRKIKILPPEVANRIAAGEVVERPASVVKELVENSIDAGAGRVTVSLVTAGKSLIEVSDDGCGMSRADCLVAVERFGTSKIETEEGLETVSTLGFRGEALPSIASVSRFKILSKAEGEEAFEFTLLGGLEPEVLPASREVGTTISVESLFFNVPARKAFLRTDQSELSEIKTLLMDLAVSRPEIGFSLVSDGVVVADYPAVKDIFARINWLGDDLISVEKEFHLEGAGEATVQAVLTNPLKTVRSANKLRVLVNSRSVRDKTILSAVRAAFGNYLNPGKFPAGYVVVNFPPQFVDVNIHPRKSEVRFSDSSLVFRLVMAALKQEVQPSESVPSARSEFVPSFTSEAPSSESSQEVLVTESVTSDYRYLGQALSCFLMFEKHEQVVLLDMHAAHERIVYNKLLNSYYSDGASVQPFLIPEQVAVGAPVVDKFRDFQNSFYEIGFDVEVFSDSTLAVRSVPSALVGVRVDDLFQDIDSFLTVKESAKQKMEAVMARIACHSSIRKGRDLGRHEAYALLGDILELGDDARCPHGRPVIRTLERDEIYKMFGRI